MEGWVEWRGMGKTRVLPPVSLILPSIGRQENQRQEEVHHRAMGRHIPQAEAEVARRHEGLVEW